MDDKRWIVFPGTAIRSITGRQTHVLHTEKSVDRRTTDLLHPPLVVLTKSSLVLAFRSASEEKKQEKEERRKKEKKKDGSLGCHRDSRTLPYGTHYPMNVRTILPPPALLVNTYYYSTLKVRQ